LCFSREQTNHGGELAGAELIEQLMGVLSVGGHSVSAER
jgi:hypothetical protein